MSDITINLDELKHETVCFAAMLCHEVATDNDIEAQMRKLHALLTDALGEPTTDWAGSVDVHPLLPWGFLDDLPAAPPPLSYGVVKAGEMKLAGPYGANWGSSSPTVINEKEPDPGYVITKSENGAVTSKRFKVKHKKPDRGSPFPLGLIGW